MATSSSIVCSTVRQLEVTPDTTDHEHKTDPPSYQSGAQCQTGKEVSRPCPIIQNEETELPV